MILVISLLTLVVEFCFRSWSCGCYKLCNFTRDPGWAMMAMMITQRSTKIHMIDVHKLAKKT